MRLLVLTNLFPNTANAGGAFVEERLRAYRRQGVQVRGVALTLDYGRLGSMVSRVPGRRPPRLVQPSILEPADIRFSPAHRLAIQRRGALRGWTMRHLARSLEPWAGDGLDLVVGHGMYQVSAGRLAREVARAAGVPYSVTLHGGDVNVDMFRRRSEFRTTLLGAVGVGFVSGALRRRAEDFLGPLPPAQVVGNGYDPGVFFPPPARRTDPATPTLLYVGRLAPVKGADRLPAIFRAIAAAAPAARFRVIGDGPLLPQVRAGTVGLDVEFAGRLDPLAVAEGMRAADLLLLPSRSEGWPTVIHEAQACGVSVVASDVGGVREALHSAADVVAPGADFTERFAAAAVERLTHPWPVLALSASARACTWDRIARTELDFYARLL